MGNFLDWFMEPVKEVFEEPIREILPRNANGTFKVNSLAKEETIVPTEPGAIIKSKSKFFRPKTWDEYIGQTKVKNIMKSYIEAMIRRKQVLGHVLIHGQAGTGKTTLAEIIANELQVKIQELIGSSVNRVGSVVKMIQRVNKGVLFIDEVHAVDRNTTEQLYPIMEDFKFMGNKIKPFTLIGATTELGEIIQDRKPFFDRFKIIIELDDYTTSEMVEIVKQYKDKVFMADEVIKEDYIKIAQNCRGVPRRAIRLLEARVYLSDMKQVLKNFRIIKEGYTDKDLKTLEYIANCDKGVGMQSIASYLGTSVKGYLYEIEPYLLQSGVISRTVRGRRITDIGVKKIKELKKEVI